MAPGPTIGSILVPRSQGCGFEFPSSPKEKDQLQIYFGCQTHIACTVGFHLRRIVLKNIIFYKNETSILTPFVKPRDVLNLAIQTIFYVQLDVESAIYIQSGVDRFCTVGRAVA